MDWRFCLLIVVISAVLMFVGGYMFGKKRVKDELKTIGELVIYNFEDGIDPELYLNLDEHPATFKTLSHVVFTTRNVKLGKPPRFSQK